MFRRFFNKQYVLGMMDKERKVSYTAVLKEKKDLH